jgi:predicted PurR-regulated permease PerM
MSPQAPTEIRRSQVSVKTVLTVSLTVLAVAGGLYVLLHAPIWLTLVFLAVLIACALDRAVRMLQRAGIKRRSAAVALVFLAFAALGAGAVAWLLPKAVEESRQLIQSGPELVQKAQQSRLYGELDRHFDLGGRVQSMKETLPQQLSRGAGPAVRVLKSMAKVIGGAVTASFLALFMLLSGPRLVEGFLGEVVPRRRTRVKRVLDSLYDTVGGYAGGLLVLCAIRAVATTLFLMLVRVPYAIPLGIFSGASTLIPTFGAWISGTVLIAVAFAKGPTTAILTLAFIFGFQQFKKVLLDPLVYGRAIRVDPLITFLAGILFAELLGIVGAMFAMPITAIIQVLVRELLRERSRALDEGSTKGSTGGAPRPGQPPAAGREEGPQPLH